MNNVEFDPTCDGGLLQIKTSLECCQDQDYIACSTLFCKDRPRGECHDLHVNERVIL